MKQYTRREALKLFGIGTAAVAGLGLAGCSNPTGGSNRAVEQAKEPVPASKAFSQAGVWMEYSANDGVEKDTPIRGFLCFDGKGNVTAYHSNDAKFRDLKGLSGEEILKFAKKQDKAEFEADRKHAIERADEDVETYETVFADAEFDESREIAKKVQAFQKASKYAKPKAHPYTLELETDGSGNSAAGEKLRFKGRNFLSLDITVGEVTQNGTEIPESPFEDYDDDIDLDSLQPTTSTVYDNTFAGYAGLVTVVEKDHPGFTWDTPDTKGIKVD